MSSERGGEPMKNYTIINRNGETDIEIADGKYHVVADITIEDGVIKYIDDGVWTPCINNANSEGK
jgi:hypothetical protein